MINYKIKDYFELYDGWKKLGIVYTPPLHKRIGNYDQFIEKLYKYAENYAIMNQGTILGMISFYANDQEEKVSYITEIIVDTKYQKLGIGKKLIQICIDDAKEKEMRKIRLEVKKGNSNAIGFYQRMGFQYEGMASDISIYMVCSLEDNGTIVL